MPSLTLTAVQVISSELKCDGLSFSNTKLLTKVQKVFCLLINKVLRQIKHREKNKNQLRLLLEDVNDDLNWEFEGKSKLSEAVFNYFEILKNSDKKTVNAAK